MAKQLFIPKALKKELDEKTEAGKRYRILTVFYGKAGAEEKEIIAAEIFLSDQTFDDEKQDELVVLDLAMSRALTSEEVLEEISGMKEELAAAAKRVDVSNEE